MKRQVVIIVSHVTYGLRCNQLEPAQHLIEDIQHFIYYPLGDSVIIVYLAIHARDISEIIDNLDVVIPNTPILTRFPPVEVFTALFFPTVMFTTSFNVQPSHNICMR